MHLVSPQLSFVFVKIVDFLCFSLSLSLSFFITDSWLSFSLLTFGIINSIVVVPELLLLSVSVSIPFVLCFFFFFALMVFLIFLDKIYVVLQQRSLFLFLLLLL